MSMFPHRSLRLAAAAAVLTLSGWASAASTPPVPLDDTVVTLDMPAPATQPQTSIDNPSEAPAAGQTHRSSIAPATEEIPETAAETPNIHGFFNSSFKTGYLTPRGLYVQDKGLVWQPIVGLVLPIGDLGPLKKFTVVGGIWNDVDTAEAGAANPTTGGWDEMDPFISVAANLTPELSATLTYVVFDSPQHGYSAEHNIDLKFAYDDTKCWGSSGFGLHPYIDCWWAVSGGSTVVLGQAGATGYFEPGIVPTYTCKMIPSYPVTFTLPTYVSIGPRSYWAAHGLPGGNFGVFSCSLSASVPLAFIPTRYGFWHADAGFTYDYLINTSLLHAGTILSGNTDRNVALGSIGFGVNF